MRKSRSVDEIKNKEALSSARRPKTETDETTKSKTRKKSKSIHNRSSIAAAVPTTETKPRSKSMRRSRSMDAMLVGEKTNQSNSRPKRRSDKATLAGRNSSFSSRRGDLKTTVESTHTKGVRKNTVRGILSSGGDDDGDDDDGDDDAKNTMDSSEVLASLYSGLYQTPKPAKATHKKSLHRRTLSSDNDGDEIKLNRKQLARRRRSGDHASPISSNVRRSSSEGDLDFSENYTYKKSDQGEKVTESSDRKVCKKSSTRRRVSSKGDLMGSNHATRQKTPKSGRRVKESLIRRSVSDGDIDFSDGEDTPSTTNRKEKKTLGHRLNSSEALDKNTSSIRRSSSNGELDSSDTSDDFNKNRDPLEVAHPEPTKKRTPRRSTSAIGGRSHKVGSFQILQALQQNESGWDNATRNRSVSRERRGTGGDEEDEEEGGRPPRRATSHGSLRGLRASSGHGTSSVEKSQRRSRTSSTVRDRMSQTRQRPGRSNSGLDKKGDHDRQLRGSSSHDHRKRPSKRDSGIKASSSHGGRKGESARPRPRQHKIVDNPPDPKPLIPSSSHGDLRGHDEISPKREANVAASTRRDTSSHGGLVNFFDKADDLQDESGTAKGKGAAEATTPGVLSVYGFLSGTATASKPISKETSNDTASGIFSRLLSTGAATTDNNEKDTTLFPALRRTLSGQGAIQPALRRTSSNQSLNREGQDGIATNGKSAEKDPLRSQSAHSGIMGPMDIKKQMSFRVKKNTDKGGKPTLRSKKEFSDLDDSFESHGDSGLIA